MTKFWPSKAEVSTLVPLLEGGEFKSAEALARAVLKEAYRLLLERDFYVTIIGNGAGQFGYGLTTTPAEAQKLAIIGPARVLNITSAARKMRDVEGG